MALRPFMLALACVGTLLASTLPGPASAFHNPPYPLVWSHPFSDRAWEAVRVTVPAGGTAIWEVQGTMQHVRMNSFGFWQLHADGSLYAAFTSISLSAGDTTVRAELPAPAGTVFDSQGAPTASGFTGGAAATQVAGDWILLSIAASEGGSVPDGVFNLYASPGVVVRSVSNGTSTFAMQDLDFHGTANVLASSSGARAKAQFQESATTSVTHKLFGLFNVLSSGAAASSYDAPTGHVSAPLKNTHWFTNQAAGAYKFNVDATADAGALFVQPFAYAFGADVELPAP